MRKITLWAVVVLAILSGINGWHYARTLDHTAGKSAPAPANEAGQNPARHFGATTTGQSAAKLVLENKLTNNVTAPSLTQPLAAAIFARERITFGENCKLAPESISVKNGATLMFDNRSRDGQSFKLDGAKYELAGYGFKLLQLKSTNLPRIVILECGDGQEKALITLE